MAHINITVTGNEYTIEMDNHGWDYLTINGGQPMYVTGSTLKHKQASPFEFAAYASKSAITIVNGAPNFFLMKGTDQNHEAILTYNIVGFNVFVLQGQLMNVSSRGGATPGPFSFSQTNMTGIFSLGN